MHSYEVEGRRRIFVIIAGVSILLVWVFHLLLDTVQFTPEWWLSVPSFAGCYSGLYWLFDHYLWRFELLRILKLVQAPNLNGKWTGEVKSSYSEYKTSYPVSVEILQRWSRMVIRLETEYSRSRSIMLSFRTFNVPYPELSYLYINEPKANAPNDMEIHRGTSTLELKDSNLVGEYYSGRGRRTIGTVSLSRC